MPNGETGNEYLKSEDRIIEAINQASSFFTRFDLDMEPNDQGEILVDQETLFAGGANAIAQACLALQMMKIEFPKKSNSRTVEEARIAFNTKHETGLNNLNDITTSGLQPDLERPLSVTGVATALSSFADHLVTKMQTREGVRHVGVL